MLQHEAARVLLRAFLYFTLYFPGWIQYNAIQRNRSAITQSDFMLTRMSEDHLNALKYGLFLLLSMTENALFVVFLRLSSWLTLLGVGVPVSLLLFSTSLDRFKIKQFREE